MRCVLVFAFLSLAIVAFAEEDVASLRSQLDALVPDAKEDGSSAVYTAPLKAKLFQLSSRLTAELDALKQRKGDVAAALAKAKVQLEDAAKVHGATQNELNRKTPSKMEADYNVVLARASLEVVIRAAKRQLKLNNLERDALFGQIKFAEQAQVLRSHVVGEKPPVALMSLEDLESEIAPQARALLLGKETSLARDVKKMLEEVLAECRDRISALQHQDDANAAEIKRLQSELKNKIAAQSQAHKDWTVAKDDFSKASSSLAKHQGMYNEMLRISNRDGQAIESKIATISKEIQLVGSMVTKIEQYKPAAAAANTNNVVAASNVAPAAAASSSGAATAATPKKL